MNVLGKHRIAFNNLGVQLFGELERGLESALKKGAEEKAELERLVSDQKKLLEEQDTRVQQAAKIREQKKKIEELSIELAEALVENKRLEGLLTTRDSDGKPQRTALRTALDSSLQNKENISPIFNYLAPSLGKAPTLNRSISPPPKSPRKLHARLSSTIDHGVQTEPLYQIDQDVQTDSFPVPNDLAAAYYDLAASYDVLRDELNTYKGAHEELQEKYLKNKKIWEAWTRSDAERREKSKKRRREGSVTSEAGGRQIVHGYTTPARSIAGYSPYSIPPPTLSPNKPVFKSPIPHAMIKKPGLFASFKGSLEKTNASGDLDIGIGISKAVKNINAEDIAASEEGVHLGPERNNNTFRPSSISETLVPSEVAANPNTVSHSNFKDPSAPGLLEDIEDTTDGESSDSRSGIITPTVKPSSRSELEEGESSVLPPCPDQVFKVPKIKKEKLKAKCTRLGNSVLCPVVIKSEPSSASSEGFGYHLFEQESLDLDDIGYKLETPRKRQKLCDSSLEEPISGESSGRVGWINGGFTIKRAPGVEETQYPDVVGIEETQDEDESSPLNEVVSSVPRFSPLAMNYGESENIKMDSLPARPQTSPGTTSAITILKRNLATTSMKRSTEKVTDNKEDQPSLSKMGISPPPLGDWLTPKSGRPSALTPVQRGLPIEEPIRRKPSPPKIRTRRRATSAEAIAAIAEDGTDGIEDFGGDSDFLSHPPMILTEKQRRNLEVTTRLSEILNSPAPKTPSLAYLKGRMDASKSAPAKRSLEKMSENTSSSEPPKRNDWISPMRRTRGKKIKQSKLDISHFRVNPDLNEGRDYAFAETVRNREARKCLPGCVKSCCRELVGFVEAAGLPPPAPRGPRWRSSSPPAPIDEAYQRVEEEAADRRFTAKFGKHRDAFARRKSPPGFWNADFPDTQDIEKQNEAAEQMRIQKVEDMRREAEKGKRGRYVYKDQ